MMKSKEKKQEFKKGAWEPKEDLLLTKYIETHGEGKWTSISKRSGLMREGRSCRMRWKNYLRPNIKRGPMSVEEEDLIVRMHKLLGNRWSLIAGRIPGRSDNEIKNYWNTRLSKKMNNQSKTRSSTSKRRELSQYSTNDQQTASESTHSSNKGSDKNITKKQEIILDHHQLEDKSWNSDPHSETAFYQEPVSPFMNSIMFDLSFELSVVSQTDNSPMYFMSDNDGYPFLL